MALFVLFVGAMGIAACGGDDDAKTSATAKASVTSQGSQSTTTATTAATGEPTGEATEPPTAAATQPAGGNSSSVGNACDLLTKSEVEEALGETVNAPDFGDSIDTPISGGGTASVTTCGYTSESYASSISVTFWSAPGLDQGIQGMINLACTGKDEVSGVGDQACWYDSQHLEIQAAKGGYFLDIFATMSGDATDVLQTLASKAADRLS